MWANARLASLVFIFRCSSLSVIALDKIHDQLTMTLQKMVILIIWQFLLLLNFNYPYSIFSYR
jgi:hypothetical protein